MTEQERIEKYKQQQDKVEQVCKFLLSIGKDFKVSQGDCSNDGHRYSETNYGLSYYIDIEDKITFEVNDECYVVISTMENKYGTKS